MPNPLPRCSGAASSTPRMIAWALPSCSRCSAPRALGIMALRRPGLHVRMLQRPDPGRCARVLRHGTGRAVLCLLPAGFTPRWRTPVASLLVQMVVDQLPLPVGELRPAPGLHHVRGPGVLHPDHRGPVRAPRAASRMQNVPTARWDIPFLPVGLHPGGHRSSIVVLLRYKPQYTWPGLDHRAPWHSRLLPVVPSPGQAPRTACS